MEEGCVQCVQQYQSVRMGERETKNKKIERK